MEEDIKILEKIIQGNEFCIKAIYSSSKIKDDEDVKQYQREIQSIKNVVNNYLKEKARADKLEKEYIGMLTETDEWETNSIPKQKIKDKIERYKELQLEYINKYDEDSDTINGMINVMKELLEERN